MSVIIQQIVWGTVTEHTWKRLAENLNPLTWDNIEMNVVGYWSVLDASEINPIKWKEVAVLEVWKFEF